MRLPRVCSAESVGVLGIALAGLFAGCEALHEAGVPGMSQYVDTETPRRELDEHRTAYQETRDPQALNWLLRHRIRTGMPLNEVNEILGEDGEHEVGAGWVKTAGPFRQDDDVYRWGPDAKGRSIYLVFRDRQLINFNPHSPDFQLGMDD